jgi:phage-related protein
VTSKPDRACVFYKTEADGEPVRDWLRGLSTDARALIGGDIRTVQREWPIGMPLVRPLGRGLYEIRSVVESMQHRVLFAVIDGKIVLLHAFVKKRQTAPDEIKVGRTRLKEILNAKK